MRAFDVTETLILALVASGYNRAEVVHKPRLLSDNGSSYIAGDLADCLEHQGIDHVRGAPNHPQTQGKIECWHQTLKDHILLENYYLLADIEADVGAFVERYNLRRYHECPCQPNAGRRLLRPGPRHHREKENDQRPDYPQTPLGPSEASGLTSTRMSQSLCSITASDVPFILTKDTSRKARIKRHDNGA